MILLLLCAAYVNGQRQGKIIESPFSIGDCIARENIISDISERPIPTLDVESEIKMAMESRAAWKDNDATVNKMKELGRQR